MEYALRAPRGTHAEDGRSLNPCFNGSAFFEGLIESTPFASQSQPALRATRCYVVASNLFANFLVLMEYALRVIELFSYDETYES